MPWTDPSAAIGVDRPIRASTHLAIMQNFYCLANGDTGAPRIQAAALDFAGQGVSLYQESDFFGDKPDPFQWNSVLHNDNFYNLGVITIPTTGLYQMDWQIEWESNIGDDLFLSLNGGIIQPEAETRTTGNGLKLTSMSRLLPLAVNDQIFITETSGGGKYRIKAGSYLNVHLVR